MRAFIIRPFGVKEGIDFEAVEARLLAPALDRVGVRGRTTAEIVSSGNIREDMFRRLLSSDLAIADISLGNPNVFYELGIRHAVRDRSTLLVRCGDVPPPPFDVLTDRYFAYDRAAPEAHLEGLVAALRETLASERCDSPVHHLVPGLAVSDPALVAHPPSDFLDEVERARLSRGCGRLALLAEEVVGLPFERAGLRLVAAAQQGLGDYPRARHSWQAVVDAEPDDVEANTKLAAVLQQLGRVDESEVALKQALRCAGADSLAAARVHALLARNESHRWRDIWRAESDERRLATALRSSLLRRALDLYERAFSCDLNFTYAAQRCLSLHSILVHLATAQPEVWSWQHPDPDTAARALEELRQEREELAVTVKRSVRAALERERGQEDRKGWAALSWAEYHCLTHDRPGYVASLYRQAMERAGRHVADSADRQLGILQELGVCPVNVEAAREVVRRVGAAIGERTETGGGRFPTRVLIFTGHRTDTERLVRVRGPRLPEALAEAARERIRSAVLAEEEQAIGPVVAVAALAAGGDILFHEVCREQGLYTFVRLPFSPREYMHQAVQEDELDVEVLGETDELPGWLITKRDYGVRRRANLWMLYEAFAIRNAHVTLIALWNGEVDPLPGGVDDMVCKARLHGAKVIHVDTRELAPT